MDGGSTGIFAGTAGSCCTTIADSSGSFSSFSGPAINSAGMVAFQATLDGGEVGVFTGNNESCCTTIADSSGPYNFFGSPSINDVGTVAVVASLKTGGESIVTGSASGCCTIIGGPFFPGAGTVPDINANGTVAFGAPRRGGSRASSSATVLLTTIA